MTARLALALAALWGCSGDDEPMTAPEAAATPVIVADVTDVAAGGSEEAYTFAVTVASPDSGCGQFADWWEVVDPGGRLLYRRILLHSHVTEQPFTRTGGPVPAEATDTLWVRAHMHVSGDNENDGYGGQAMKGTPAGGFTAATWPPGLGTRLETADPQPTGCAF